MVVAPRDKRRPMSILVKICGINSAEAADAALAAGADFCGLAFHAASPRNVSAEQAASLAARMRGRARIVALFADASDEEIASAMRAAQPDMLQLHGKESPERVAGLRARFHVDVIKAIPVAETNDLANVPAYEAVADMLLFDAKAPANANRQGGHGAAFDWQLLRNRTFTRPWLLAGGLHSENVARAIRISGAPGVDVSSGVESAPGMKSAEKIRAFAAAVHAAQYERETQ
jgi:phosphoribosylanthranilate isomerase